MEQEMRFYSIGDMAKLSGVSTRTLRYYESEELIKPKRNEANYRVYNENDAKQLAQILAMRACGLSIADIKGVFDNSGSSLSIALEKHLQHLFEQKTQIEALIVRSEEAIKAIKRISNMESKKAFEELKKQAIFENEKEYGHESRALYGDEVIDAANEHLEGLSEDEWDEKQALEEQIKSQLQNAMKIGDPKSTEARELAQMHARWICLHWGENAYSREAHLGLAKMYAADKRFIDYYDRAAGKGATEFLVKALEENI